MEHIERQSFQRISICQKAISSCTVAYPKPPQQGVHTLVQVPHMEVVGVGVGQHMEVVQSMAHTLELRMLVLVLLQSMGRKG